MNVQELGIGLVGGRTSTGAGRVRFALHKWSDHGRLRTVIRIGTMVRSSTTVHVAVPIANQSPQSHRRVRGLAPVAACVAAGQTRAQFISRQFSALSACTGIAASRLRFSDIHSHNGIGESIIFSTSAATSGRA
jgi:hypothetical protein